MNERIASFYKRQFWFTWFIALMWCLNCSMRDHFNVFEIMALVFLVMMAIGAPMSELEIRKNHGP
jgi:hypothetical protein